MISKKIAPKKPSQESVEKVCNRIARIEGQLKGVRKMIDSHKECIDIITQITAIREAVSMLGIELLKTDFACKFEDGKKIDEKYLKLLFKMR